MRARAPSGLRATVAAFAAAVAVFCSGSAAGGESERFRPSDGEQVLLVLPAALAESMQLPPPAGEWETAASRAEEYLRLARTSHDPRYFGRAQALLRPWMDRPAVSPRLDIVAADLAQQRHEFAEARRLLDRALGGEPRNIQARLMRANLALLAGEFDAARLDCLAVMQAGSALPGTVCLATAMTGPGSLERARQLLAALDRAEPKPTPLTHWRLLIQSDLATRAGEGSAAIEFLERAHALDPEHEETRVRLAAALLERGGAVRALELSGGTAVSPALLVARIRASSSLDAAQAAAARAELDALLAVGRRRGAEAHLREESEIALYGDRDAARALAIARRNFTNQKDTRDLRLLLDAALAARDEVALASIRRWLTATGFEDHVADARLREAGA